MNLEMKFSAMCVGKKVSKSHDGKNEYYNVSVAKNGEAGTLSCTLDVFNQVEEYQPHDFTALYRDGQYTGLRVTHAVPTNSSFPKSDSNGNTPNPQVKTEKK